jgi:CheY-like chemotaxis protein
MDCLASRTRLAALGLIVLMCPSILFGQRQESGPKSLKNLSLEELSKIEVTTLSKESTEAFRTPAAINVLTREDIARSGATTIPDLLRLLPGVEVSQLAADKWALGIRGFQGYLSKSVLVMIDGRSVYTPLFAGVYWEMQDTLIEDIDRIEVRTPLPDEASRPYDRLRILVLEDNVDAAEMLRHMLQLRGHEVRAVFDGEVGLETAYTFHPHVVLCDIGLPRMSGYEVALRLRSQQEFKSTRLIALSGYGQEGDRVRSKEAGFDYHLTKPVEPDTLLELLGTFGSA